jgi:hypothetical protein
VRSVPILPLIWLAISAAGATASCQQQPVQVSVRSLERSGRVAFVCLGSPNETSPNRSLLDPNCNRINVISTDDFQPDDAGSTTLSHLYGLVTQTARGEVAVVDLTATDKSVIDEDKGIPGANFLPIGADPGPIVTTPGGTAAFVGTGEVGREGIFALPSTMIRPRDGVAPPTLSSWPSCALPAAPGEMVLAFDPDQQGLVRPTCDGNYGAPPAVGDHGDLGAEGKGREKLIVTLPDLGGFVVIDAQTLLDGAAGAFAPCVVERWVPLVADVPPPPDPVPIGPHSPYCVPPAQPKPTLAPSYTPRPGGVALDGTRLFVADLDAPVIHVVDLPNACEPTELDSLLPSSVDEPARAVTTTKVAVSGPVGVDLKRYLYAVDQDRGSAMVFDVSDGASAKSRSPLRHAHPELNPFLPVDRIVFPAPARDIVMVSRDVPIPNPSTGVATSGVRCDPDPSLCTSTSANCDVASETLYRTDTTTYASGAGPRKLRGTFAFAILTSGNMEVIDIDDLDAACRGPVKKLASLGCSGLGDRLVTSDEQSCNIVEPHLPRAQSYFLDDDNSGLHQPGLITYPTLVDQDGALLDRTMTALALAAPNVNGNTSVAVAGKVLHGTTSENCEVGKACITKSGIIQDVDGQARDAVIMNLEEPRVHVADQTWAITYEGQIPGFDGQLAELRFDGDLAPALVDGGGRFCDHGALGAQQLAGASVYDYVEITSPLIDQVDGYWTSVSDTCTYDDCLGTYGTPAAPTLGRDFPILEAYEDHVSLFMGAPGGGDRTDQKKLKCCFPSFVSFSIRGGNQWIVTSDASGFIHHVIADPATGACRVSCDATAERLNGRSTAGTDVPFKNPFFETLIVGTPPETKDKIYSLAARDTSFQFTTNGSFSPLYSTISTDGSQVLPQSATFLPTTGQIAVTDGASQGLILINTGTVSPSRALF